MKSRIIEQYLEMLDLSGVRELFLSTPLVLQTKVEKPIFASTQKQAETNTPANAKQRIAFLRNQYKNCQKCKLSETRTRHVYGEGNEFANLMIIGEAPGSDEDKSGLPFVGKAGQLLTKMLQAIQIERKDVFICNIAKCRPPNNRDPEPDEVEACLPYLLEQIEIVQPKILLLLGKVAAHTLLQNDLSMNKLNDGHFTYQGISTYVTYHPSALLRHEEWKRPAWEVLKRLQKEYTEL